MSKILIVSFVYIIALIHTQVTGSIPSSLSLNIETDKKENKEVPPLKESKKDIVDLLKSKAKLSDSNEKTGSTPVVLNFSEKPVTLSDSSKTSDVKKPIASSEVKIETKETKSVPKEKEQTIKNSTTKPVAEVAK